MRKLSDLPGLDVYMDNGKRLGKAYDFVIDLQKGEVARVTLQPIESLSGADTAWIKQNTVSFKNVVSVQDIIIVSSKPREEAVDEAPAPAPVRPKYSFAPRYGYGK
jgi:sporulation protein YlmC with PRC-barrel domain